MLLVWEKGIGLTYYMHGSGGMDMHVELDHNLKEEQKTAYGYPFKLFHEVNNATDEQEEQSDMLMSGEAFLNFSRGQILCY